MFNIRFKREPKINYSLYKHVEVDRALVYLKVNEKDYVAVLNVTRQPGGFSMKPGDKLELNLEVELLEED